MNYSDYQTKLPYPDKKNFIKVFVYKQGEVILDGVTYMEFLEFIDKQPKKEFKVNPTQKDVLTANGLIKEEIFFDTKYQEAKEKYADDVSRLLRQFEEDALKELGLEDHPNAHGFYAYAWNKGHSGGLQEVFEIMNELSDYFG